MTMQVVIDSRGSTKSQDGTMPTKKGCILCRTQPLL